MLRAYTRAAAIRPKLVALRVFSSPRLRSVVVATVAA